MGSRKFYLLEQFNRGGDHCSYRVVSISGDRNIDDYLNEYEVAREISERMYENCSEKFVIGDEE